MYVFDNFIRTTIPYEEDEDIIEEDPVRVNIFKAALDQFVAYMESTWLGTPRPQDVVAQEGFSKIWALQLLLQASSWRLDSLSLTSEETLKHSIFIVSFISHSN